ncbi:MAG: hypothetical protein WD396_04495 [Pseudohongiellaceae bacterium]
MPTSHSLNRLPFYLALALAVLPTMVINITYLIAAGEGHVPHCIPYWESCTSISATGRQGTAFFFFKLTMVPMAGVYWWYWREANLQLNRLGYRGRVIVRLGAVAALALGCYALALGATGDSFRLTRRIGIILYFTFTYLCQLLIVYQLGKQGVSDRSRHWQQGLLLLILGIGLLTLVLDVILPNYEDYEDAFEWNVALLLHLNFLLAAIGWYRLTLRGERS